MLEGLSHGMLALVGLKEQNSKQKGEVSKRKLKLNVRENFPTMSYSKMAGIAPASHGFSLTKVPKARSLWVCFRGLSSLRCELD